MWKCHQMMVPAAPFPASRWTLSQPAQRQTRPLPVSGTTVRAVPREQVRRQVWTAGLWLQEVRERPLERFGSGTFGV